MAKVCDALVVNLIDIRTKDTEHFVNEVRASEKILCEAMHGAIVSDAFNIPWKGFSAYDHIHHEKWNDWLSVFDQKITLHEVSSLYKGFNDLSFKEQSKNHLKHILLNAGIWSKGWDKPQPKKTNNKMFENICDSVATLISSDGFSATNRTLVDQQLEKLKAVLKGLDSSTQNEKVS